VKKRLRRQTLSAATEEKTPEFPSLRDASINPESQRIKMKSAQAAHHRPGRAGPLERSTIAGRGGPGGRSTGFAR